MADITTIQDGFSYSHWTKLSADEKLSLCQQLSDHYADQFGIPHVKVSAESMEGGEYGGWNGSRVALNSHLFENGTTYPDSAIDRNCLIDDSNHQLYDTVAHETRHAYQSWALDHPEEFVARAEDKEEAVRQLHEWQLNEGHYEKTENGPGYFAQPQEQDAWNFGQSETDKAFEGIEARNGAEPWQVSRNYADAQVNVDEIRQGMEQDGSYKEIQSEMEKGCEAKGLDTDYSYYLSDQYANLRDVSVDEAYNNLNDYYDSHGLMMGDDYETYSQDPEWQKLNNEMRRASGEEVIRYPQHAEAEERSEEPLSQREAAENMSAYTNEHNYGQEDLNTYAGYPAREDTQREDNPEDLESYKAVSKPEEQQRENSDPEDLNSYHAAPSTDSSRSPSQNTETAENTADGGNTQSAGEEQSASL